EILNEVLAEKDVAVSLDYYFTLVGMGGLLIWEKLKKDFSLEGEPNDLFVAHKKYFFSVIESKKLLPVNGIKKFLKLLKETNYSISLGSSSPAKLIEHSVQKIGIKKYFDYMVSSEHVKNGKPFPDIF